MKFDSNPIRELVLEHFRPESALEKKRKLVSKSRIGRKDSELYIRIGSQVPKGSNLGEKGNKYLKEKEGAR